MHTFNYLYLCLYIIKKYKKLIVLKCTLRRIKQDLTCLYFFLIFWMKFKRFSLLVNSGQNEKRTHQFGMEGVLEVRFKKLKHQPPRNVNLS